MTADVTDDLDYTRQGWAEACEALASAAGTIDGIAFAFAQRDEQLHIELIEVRDRMLVDAESWARACEPTCGWMDNDGECQRVDSEFCGCPCDHPALCSCGKLATRRVEPFPDEDPGVYFICEDDGHSPHDLRHVKWVGSVDS